MQPPGRWWDAPLPKGLSSLLVALSVTFLPLWCDQVRARRSAKPIEIVAVARAGRPALLSGEGRADRDAIGFHRGDGGDHQHQHGVRAGARKPVLPRAVPVAGAASDSTARPRWDGRERMCLARGRDVSLGPGQTEVLRTTASVREVLGDSLPDGRYIVTAIFEVDGATVTRLAGAVVLRSLVR